MRDRLDGVARPLFGQVSLVILIALAFHIGYELTLERVYDGKPVGIVSVVGLLPESVVYEPELFTVLWLAFAVGAAFWLFNLGIPYSAWCATVSFVLFVSLYLQNVAYWDHRAHLLALVLVVYCAWYHFRWREIRLAIKEKRFWRTPLYPGWVYLASVYAIVAHYLLAGVSKLWMGHGFAWADGLTLQLYVWALGDPQSALGSVVVGNRALAQGMQIGGLLLELSMPIALLSRGYRIGAGILLIVFHLANLAMFPEVRFYANIGVVSTFFLIQPVLERYCSTVNQDWLGRPTGAPAASTAVMRQ